MMKKISILLGLAVIFWGVVYYYNNYYFNAEKIIENSILKNRTFNSKVEEVEAQDGKIKAYLMTNKSVPLVAMNFSFKKAGSAYEPKDGVALLAESLIVDGAGKYDRKTLRNLMKEKGIKLSVNADKNCMRFSFSYVKDFEKDAIEVLKAVLHDPHLKKDDIDLIKSQIKVARERLKEDPQKELDELVRKEFYKNHVYGKDLYPSDEKIDDLNSDDIRKYMKDYFAKDVLSVGVAGFMNKEELKQILDDVFGGLNDKNVSMDLDDFEPDYDEDVVYRQSQYSKQSFAVHIGKSVKRLDEDFYPFYVADFVLGGAGLNSRLNKRIREKEGLTYGIYSYLTDDDLGGLWNIAYSATPENAEKIEAILKDELEHFYKNGITIEELNLAKNSLISSFNLRFASLFNIALQLNLMQEQNLGRDFLDKRQDVVRNIKLEDVNRVIKTRFPKNRRIFIAKGIN